MYSVVGRLIRAARRLLMSCARPDTLSAASAGGIPCSVQREPAAARSDMTQRTAVVLPACGLNSENPLMQNLSRIFMSDFASMVVLLLQPCQK